MKTTSETPTPLRLRLAQRDTRCARCGAVRPDIDMAIVNDDAYCHPSWSMGTTCYIEAIHG